MEYYCRGIFLLSHAFFFSEQVEKDSPYFCFPLRGRVSLYMWQWENRKWKFLNRISLSRANNAKNACEISRVLTRGQYALVAFRGSNCECRRMSIKAVNLQIHALEY